MGSWVRRSSAAIVFAIACGGSAQTGAPPGVSTEPSSSDVAVYAFDSLDARPVSAAAFAGKVTVLTFVTTYDPISQMQIHFLLDVANDMPNVVFALVALQEPAQRELVELYRDAMKWTFPVALGDTATIAGGGTLGDVHQVPTTIVIARDGHIAWKKVGGVTASELEKHLAGL
jgi:hypothetical protein